MAGKYTAHVVSHTHWDREWYNTFQQFRMRLVDLTDTLIDLMEKNPDYKFFVFDGQAIVLEDYLEIRPENEQRLRKLIKDGRILIGPWYNQPDEFLVSGECMIRNLLVGKKQCEDYGNYMAVGYVPDAFGHISQFPQLMLGFGIDNAVLFRGITTDQTDAEFTWRSPDGSEILAIKMPDNNAYSNFFYRMQNTLKDPAKPIDPDQAINELKTLIDDCIRERPTTSRLLFMDGVDHIFPQFKTPEIIKLANERLDNVKLEHSTLPEFVEAVKNEHPKLQTFTGELRWSNRDWKLQAVLTHVLSSRIHLKQMNWYCERLLEKYVEPLYSWIWMLGGDYPKSYIDLAWKYVLQNSPHDSICGCSIDQVHKDMIYRFDQAKQIGEQLYIKGLANIADKIGSTAEKPERTLVAPVFNMLSHTRTDVVDAWIDFPGDWNVRDVRVIDPKGEEVPSALVARRHKGGLEQTAYDIPYGISKNSVRVEFVADDVPSVGYKAYRIEALDKPNRQPATMLLGPDTAENEHISITIGSDGTFYLLDKATDAVYTSCLIFEDGGDFGDGYNYTKPLQDKVVTSLGAKCAVSVVENNAVRVVFGIDMDLELPARRSGDGRSSETVTCKTKTLVTLTAGLKRIDIKTVFDNQAKDHRLRVLFPTGIPAKASYAEGTFDVVERSIAIPPCTDWKEPLPVTHPQNNFVDVSGGGIGFAAMTRGLPEFEVKDDEARTIALTLLRATGGGVRGPEQQVEGQIPGEHVFEYAIYPHSGNWEEGESYKQGYNFNVPLVVGLSGIHEGELPMEMSFVDTGDTPFVVSAVKKAENDEALIVRGYNIGTSDISVPIEVAGGKVIELTDLKEDSIEPIKSGKFAAKPKQIRSCKVKRG